MTPPARNQEAPRRGRAIGIAVTVLALVITGALVSSAGAIRAKEMGKTKTNPKPACSEEPASECQITGQVTGFQRAVRGKANLFKAPADGRIVAWSVHLASPSQEERDVFGEAAMTERYGKSPTAGIGILRKKQNRVFRLMRHSPILRVGSHYGTKPVFTLNRPLRIREGNIVALTTATWLPAFAVEGQRRKDVWVASRVRKNCEIPPDVPDDERLEWFFDHTRPHTKKKSDRKYACTYTNARLLYWAYFVPNR